ncbi:uncharacterized protein LOC143161256 [Aptenodytes patagonicus]|uniref:uncharacterized protein LOC143161256 n=1 Tax=Aptenodytes patagonicus TaxID=9234 RepID=UPI003FA0C77F
MLLREALRTSTPSRRAGFFPQSPSPGSGFCPAANVAHAEDGDWTSCWSSTLRNGKHAFFFQAESTQRATLWPKPQNALQSSIEKTEKFCGKKGRVSQSSDRLAVDLMNINSDFTDLFL